MKKNLKIICLIIVAALLWAWGVSFLKAEYLTCRHGDEFADLWTATNMLSGIDELRVLSYSRRKAKVYYVGAERSNGNIYWFVRDGDTWQFDRWDTVWSSSGSADGIMWPYIR